MPSCMQPLPVPVVLTNRMMTKERNKRVVVFASFSKDGKIADYVVYYLKALRRVADCIIFVSDNEMKPGETDKLSGLVATTICRRHGTYDFGSYRIGYFWALEHNLLDDTEDLVFANDSCYGPVYPFDTVFDRMAGKPCDFWGLTDSYETAHHLLSFFLVFKRKVFTSRHFHNFVSGFARQASFWGYVYSYERKFTEVLEANGFRSAVYVDIDEETRGTLALKGGNGNPTTYPLFLFRRGMPLVKVKAMNGSYGMELNDSPWQMLQEMEAVNPELHDIIVDDLRAKGVKREDRWFTPAEIVEDAKVVSFDIFDTLLARPYVKPTDLFLHMEEISGMAGFRDSRVKAEKRARSRHREQADVTLDQIYEEIGARYASLKEQELRHERECLYAKADGRSIYDEAVRRGKTIIAVSDMYLPQAFLEQVLREKGYGGISRVFVSNAENCCKGDGRLFRKVLKEMGIAPADMVHVGDNYESDKKAAEALGIRAFHRPSEAQALFDCPAMGKYKFFAEANPGLASSVLTELYARRHAAGKLSNPFEELGYYLGGPLVVGYCMHIRKVAVERGNDAILFVSRDGYALHRVYQAMFPDDIPSYYIYASRKLILRNSIDYKNLDYLKNVREIYSRECLQGKPVTDDNAEQYREQMEQWAAENAEHYRKYVDSLHITGRKIMSVDMTTRSYTSLYMLRRVFGDRIDCGMFSISYGEPCDYTVLSYAGKEWRVGDIPAIIMQEELITAPERSAQSVDRDGHIVFSPHNPIEDYRVERYKEVIKGIDSFAHDFLRSFPAGCAPGLSFDLWLRLFHSYVSHSHYGDHELLKSIYHDDLNQRTYDNLYDVCIQKEPVQALDLSKLYQKNQKHLKGIRKLVVALSVETAILVALLVWLLAF